MGDVDKYEVRFSFPRRSTNDFRYNKSLGGGALFDCGGYTIMLADILLEGRGKILDFAFEYLDGFEVDMGGMGRMTNEERECCFSFGMAHPYNCYLKARGTKGVLIAPRVLTAPSDFDVKFDLLDNHGDMVKQIDVGMDDTFLKSIDNFYNCIVDPSARDKNVNRILRQAKLVEELKRIGEAKI